MKRSFATFLATVAILGAHCVAAQEAVAGPGTLEVTVIPGGATFFTTKNGAPKFVDDTLGGAAGTHGSSALSCGVGEPSGGPRRGV